MSATKKIPKNLKPFFSAVETIPMKNCGGCLLFCYTFWLWLLKNNMPTETFQIVQYESSYEKTLQHNLRWINKDDEIDHPDSSCHFTWMYNGVEYDSENVINSPWTGANDHAVLEGLNGKFSTLVEEFCVSALNNAGWNTMFRRNIAIEQIQEYLEIDLSAVKI